MKDKKLLHVIVSLDPKNGGVSQALKTLKIGLSKIGVQNEIVSLDALGTNFLSGYNEDVHPIGLGKGPWGFHPQLIPWLAQNLCRFDAVILHGLWQFPSYAIHIALNQAKKRIKSDITIPKFFIMPHGMLDPYFQQAPERKLKAFRNWLFWKLIERKVVNNADGLLFTCEEERNLAKTTFKPYHPKQEIVVGLGVEKPPTFALSMKKALLKFCPNLEDRPFILFLSRIHKKKGVDLLIEAYSELYEYYKERKITNSNQSVAEEFISKSQLDLQMDAPILVIAGPGIESSYGQKVKELADKTLTTTGLILFPGMLSGEAKWGAFYGCEAFVLPSHQENFGIAVVEALACSKPVLISNKINIWKEIEANEAGLISEDSKEGILSLLKTWKGMSKEKKDIIGQNAEKTYNNLYAVKPNCLNIKSAIFPEI